MKKLLLTTLALGLTIGVYAQDNRTQNNELSAPNNKITDTQKMSKVGPVKANIINRTVASTPAQSNAKSAAISIVAMGHAANAFGSIAARTQLFAMPSLNTVAFMHRSTSGTQTPPGGGSGFYRIDVSMDGGATFTNNIDAYDPTDTVPALFANGRYPQGLIYNPPGNTTPANAYWSWNGPTLTGGNGGSWGSYAHGSIKLDGTAAVQDQTTGPSAGGAYYQVPDDMTLGAPGKAWICEPSINLNLAVPDYIDSLMIREGTWGAGDYTWVDRVVPFPVSADADSNKQMAVSSIAFNASGMIGYISTLSHISYVSEPDSVLTLVFVKTTDGGATWGAPVQVDISSIADPLLASDPNGSYSTGFEVKTAVDMNDNLHAVMAVGPDASGFSIGTTFGEWGILAVNTTDGGTNWTGMLLATPHQFRGTWDPTGNALTEDSRPYITTTVDRSKMFYSWLDTDSTVFGTMEGNAHPDLWMVGYDVVSGLSTVATNFTTGSAADGEVSYGVASKYAFEPAAGTFEIPYNYMINDPSTSATDVKPFNYIKGVEFVQADFSVGINDINNDLGTLTGAYPNPMDNVSYLDLNLDVKANVVVTITNALGQVVRVEDKGTLSAGTYKLAVEKDGLSAGLYVVNVSLNQSTLSQKLIIQ